MPWITIEPPPEPVRETPTAIVVASQLGLGAIVLLVMAMTYRRLREEPTSRETPSKRSVELTRGGTPAHILEHIARISDPEYICLAIAENKLTVSRVNCCAKGTTYLHVDVHGTTYIRKQ